MKKILLTLGILLLSVNSMLADNYVVGNVTVPKGGTATLAIALDNPTNECGGFEFVLAMGESITVSSPVKGSRVSDDFELQGNMLTEGFKVLAYNTKNLAIDGTSGTIVTVTLTADAELSVGATIDGHLTSAFISDRGGTSISMDAVNFTITIGEPSDGRTVLDETSTTAPEAAENVNVRVLRTIKANEWSTIVLPFAMSEAQVKTAFGDDVKLADFTSWSSEEDDEGDIMSISVGFTAIDAIAANHPCLIKVSSAISEFTVDGVDIDPEDEPTVQVGKKKVEKGFLIGTYVAQTVVPENNLFLSENEFWYSTGLTKMKAFRAYFELYDVLAQVEDGYNSATNIRLSVSEGEATGVKGVGEGVANRATGVYTLQGVKVNGTRTLPKGVYVVNGKKVVKN